MKPCDYDSRPKYDLLIEPLRKRARELGYAIGVHGTLKRDIDLIACPWSNEAADPKTLAEALRLVALEVVGAAYMIPPENEDPFHLAGCPGMKPHGRLCWTFHMGGGPYIDLSVMPREVVAGAAREEGLREAYRAMDEMHALRKARCVEKCNHPADYVCDYEDGTCHCLECVAEKFWQIDDILSGKHNVHTYWGALATIAHPERMLRPEDPVQIARRAIEGGKPEGQGGPGAPAPTGAGGRGGDAGFAPPGGSGPPGGDAPTV